MVPRLAAAGGSFRGAFDYYAHDKGARTTGRIAWEETINMLADGAAGAWKVMAWTAKTARQLKAASGQFLGGNPTSKPVLAYSLAWHPEQSPDKATMMQAATESLAHLGLSEHQAIVIAHTDEAHPHCHVIASKIHPRTGVSAKLRYTKRKLQDFAREWQRREGTRYCPQREKNYRNRMIEKKPTKYRDPAINAAWGASQNGVEFAAQLESKGYQLARGRKRIVVVDPYGKTINPVRELPVKAAAFNARIADLDPAALPTPEDVLTIRRDQASQEAARRPEPKTEHQAPPAPAEPKSEPIVAQTPDAPRPDPALEMRQRHHEIRSAEALAHQRLQHEQERRDLTRYYDHRITQTRNDLIAHHRLHEQRDTLRALRERIRNPGLLRRTIGKALGLIRHDRKEFTTCKAAYDEARSQIRETVAALQTARANALNGLDISHAQDRRALEERLEQWSPRSRQAFNERARTLAHTRDRERDRDSPSLSR